jgi:hypothetical protein
VALVGDCFPTLEEKHDDEPKEREVEKVKEVKDEEKDGEDVEEGKEFDYLLGP